MTAESGVGKRNSDAPENSGDPGYPPEPCSPVTPREWAAVKWGDWRKGIRKAYATEEAWHNELRRRYNLPAGWTPETGNGYAPWTHPLFLRIQTDRTLSDRAMSNIAALFRTVDTAAAFLAKERADWHDDPEGDPEGYAECHKPAAEAFPEALRLHVVNELLDYYLEERRNKEKADATA